MKKAIISIIFSLIFLLTSCNDSPKANYYDDNGIGYCNGSVLSIPFDASGESAEVTILDEYEQDRQYKVSTWFRAKFYPKDPEVKIYFRDDMELNNKTLIDERAFELTVNVGKNLTSGDFLKNNIFYKEVGDDSYVKYKIRIIWNVSPENEAFYSKDGELFYKKTNDRHKATESVFD